MNFFKSRNNFLYLVMLSFIFVSSSALSVANSFLNMPSLIAKTLAEPKKIFPPLPILSNTLDFPLISAQAALATDLASGVPLYEKNPDTALLPASTTKIVTALVALDIYPPNEVLKVGKIKIGGQKMGLSFGEEIRAEDLLYGLLVYSANDAAEVLAENHPGGYAAFVSAMNAKASELHLEHSRFFNPSGLDGNGHVTTARDLVRISEVAMRNPTFSKIVSTKQITVQDVPGKKFHRLTNINELLGSVPGVLGVKTGWTENARENLVTYVERDGHRIMIAMLGSQDRFGETKELIDWIFTGYSWEPVQLP